MPSNTGCVRGVTELIDIDPFETVPTDTTTADTSASVVRIDALRNFRQVVDGLGGDPDALLAKSQIDSTVLENRHAVISYRMMVHLLERAASELKCPDFGIRLAAAQSGAKVLGPIEVVMSNSNTLGDAFRYCATHLQAYSSAVQICIERDPANRRSFIRFEILLSRLPYQRQVVEQALLLTQHAAVDLTKGHAQAREIWFSHAALLSRSTYRNCFSAVVRFGAPCNAIFFSDADLDCAISKPDPQLYEIATSYIESRFPVVRLTMSTRVRAIIARRLAGDECTNEQVASALGLHPRTLQRRLREEGECFESLKDSVRRDIALRYLMQPDLPLTRVAELLGYSEASVLSRSCARWFSASPKQLRNELSNWS
jgi:AraC-like DNA-binding protein